MSKITTTVVSLLMRHWLSHWRLVMCLLFGLVVGSSASIVWVLSFSSAFLLGWDCAIVAYLLCLIMMSYNDTLHAHLNNAEQNKAFIVTMIVIASSICVYAIARQTQVGKTLSEGMLALNTALTVGTTFIAWLMIQVIFALQYAYLYYAQMQQNKPFPLAFPEATLEPTLSDEQGTDGSKNQQDLPTYAPKFVDFLYCAITIGTSGQTADVIFITSQGRKLAMLHCVIAFVFNLTVISLLINIIAAYL